MKRTDLEKNKGLKIAGNMKRAAIPDRFGKDAAVPLDKREQRKRDQELGLVPFAVKLPMDLVKQLQARAEAETKSMNDVTAELLQKALTKK
ncbi:MAG: Arc family DNA-binding protein [Betaproteobacteria bacterium]|nr:Arc family DNA-binding protein [Betaproteobacteria bacterium]